MNLRKIFDSKSGLESIPWAQLAESIDEVLITSEVDQLFDELKKHLPSDDNSDLYKDYYDVVDNGPLTKNDVISALKNLFSDSIFQKISEYYTKHLKVKDSKPRTIYFNNKVQPYSYRFERTGTSEFYGDFSEILKQICHVPFHKEEDRIIFDETPSKEDIDNMKSMDMDIKEDDGEFYIQGIPYYSMFDMYEPTKMVRDIEKLPGVIEVETSIKDEPNDYPLIATIVVEPGKEDSVINSINNRKELRAEYVSDPNRGKTRYRKPYGVCKLVDVYHEG